MLLRIFFLSHLFACIWHFVGEISLNSYDSYGINWINTRGLTNVSVWTKYIDSFYFVVITMNTVGFGDIVATNTIERIFSIFFVFIACGVFAYTINSI